MNYFEFCNSTFNIHEKLNFNSLWSCRLKAKIRATQLYRYQRELVYWVQPSVLREYRVRRKIGKNGKHQVQSHFFKTLPDSPLWKFLFNSWFPCENTSRFTKMTSSQWGSIWQFIIFQLLSLSLLCYLFGYSFKIFDWLINKENKTRLKWKILSILLALW